MNPPDHKHRLVRPPAPHRPVHNDLMSRAPGRNVACPCGSGKKFKQCHGAPPKPEAAK